MRATPGLNLSLAMQSLRQRLETLIGTELRREDSRVLVDLGTSPDFTGGRKQSPHLRADVPRVRIARHKILRRLFGVCPRLLRATSSLMAMMARALAWKKRVLRIRLLQLGGVGLGKGSRRPGSGGRAPGVTRLTRSSVHCAERMVATTQLERPVVDQGAGRIRVLGGQPLHHRRGPLPRPAGQPSLRRSHGGKDRTPGGRPPRPSVRCG